jgi:hypothetical protein
MKIRTTTDNRSYKNLLEDAVDKISQAADSVTYPAYPEINQRLIAKLEEAMYTLEEAMEARIFKP